VSRLLALGALGALGLGGCAEALPPLPEIVVVADTDLPVPLAASRLRVDLYSAEGAWFATTDVARPDPRDWPVSFSVYSDDPTRPRRVWVRLRAYLDGRTRDYLGERPFTLGGPIAPGAPTSDAPRLIEGGLDATPPSEPDPLDAVDGLLLLELEPDTKARAAVVLRGACLGTSAILGDDPAVPTLGQARACVDAEKTRAPVALTAAPPDDGARGPSVQGTWLAEPCPPDDGGGRVCVPGGATVLGAGDLVSSGFVSALPIRTLGVHTFYLDRHEVTVADVRAALAEGLPKKDAPLVNSGALAATPLQSQCPWSPEPMGREGFAAACVSWPAARAYCALRGGDLPTETQWEHAATVAGRAAKVHYPWGNDPPSCDQAVYGGAASGSGLPACPDKGPLPRPIADGAGDLTPGGVNGLAGGVGEWTLDVAKPYADACWGDAPIVDPRCGAPGDAASERVVRGAYYGGPMTFATTRYVTNVGFTSPYVGFRCAYAGAAP